LTDPKDIIIELRNVVADRGLKPQEIVDMLEKAKTPVSLSTVRRILVEGNEDLDFSFKNVIMPMVNVLIDFNAMPDNTPEELLKKEYTLAKKDYIELQEEQINDLLVKIVEIDLKWMHQIELKDERIDKLLDSNIEKDLLIKMLMDQNVEKDELITELMKKCDNCKFHHK
jgi:hypothetical protein